MGNSIIGGFGHGNASGFGFNYSAGSGILDYHPDFATYVFLSNSGVGYITKDGKGCGKVDNSSLSNEG